MIISKVLKLVFAIWLGDRNGASFAAFTPKSFKSHPNKSLKIKSPNSKSPKLKSAKKDKSLKIKSPNSKSPKLKSAKKVEQFMKLPKERTFAPSKRHKKSGSFQRTKVPTLPHGISKTLKPSVPLVSDWTPSPFISSTPGITHFPRAEKTYLPSWRRLNTNQPTIDFSSMPSDQPLHASTGQPTQRKLHSPAPSSPRLASVTTLRPSLKPTLPLINHLTPVPSPKATKSSVISKSSPPTDSSSYKSKTTAPSSSDSSQFLKRIASFEPTAGSTEPSLIKSTAQPSHSLSTRKISSSVPSIDTVTNNLSPAPSFSTVQPPSPYYYYYYTDSPSAYPSKDMTAGSTEPSLIKSTIQPSHSLSTRKIPSSVPSIDTVTNNLSPAPSSSMVQPPSPYYYYYYTDSPSAYPSKDMTAAPNNSKILTPSDKDTGTHSPTKYFWPNPTIQPTMESSMTPTSGPSVGLDNSITVAPSMSPSVLFLAPSNDIPTVIPSNLWSTIPSTIDRVPTPQPSLNLRFPSVSGHIMKTNQPTNNKESLIGLTAVPSGMASEEPTAWSGNQFTPLSSMSPSAMPFGASRSIPTVIPSVHTSYFPSPAHYSSLQPFGGWKSSIAPMETKEPLFNFNKIVTTAPTSSRTGVQSKISLTQHPTSSGSPSHQPNTSQTLMSRCIVSDEGNFGNHSENNSFILFDYKYEMIANNTVIGDSSFSLITIVNLIEKSISSLLLPLLFSSCKTPSSLPLLRARRLETVNVLGISAAPEDIIMSDTCSASPLVADELCIVVKGRFSLYVDEFLYQSSSLVSNISTAISLGMSDGTLAASSLAIVHLQYIDEDRNSVPFDSPLLGDNRVLVTSWPAIVGAIVGMGLLLLLVVGIRRYHGLRKGMNPRKPEISDNDSLSIFSHFSLSAIWNDKALDGLDKARSFKDFVSSQPVIRLRAQPSPSQTVSHRQGFFRSLAMESSMNRAIARGPVREDYDDHGGIVFCVKSDDSRSTLEDENILHQFSSSHGRMPIETRSVVQAISTYSDSEYDYSPSTQQDTDIEESIQAEMRGIRITDFACTSLVSQLFSPRQSGRTSEKLMSPYSPSNSSLSSLGSFYYQ